MSEAGRSAAAAVAAEHQDAALFSGYARHPCIRNGRICFVAEGDIWFCEGPAWVALRLTQLGTCSWPQLSPDGSCVAFASWHLGGPEVFLAVVGQSALQPPERITFLGAPDTVPVAWALDGSTVYVSSSSRQPLEDTPAIHSIPLGGNPSGGCGGGGLAGLCPLPAVAYPLGCHDVDHLSFGPGGRALVGRWSRDCHTVNWKGYCGGQSGCIWLQVDDTTTLRKLEVHVEAETDGDRRSVPLHACLPCWVGSRIFFTAELDGCGNLWSCAADGSELRQHTFHTGLYARNPSTDGASEIVYQRGGEVWRYSTESDSAERVPILFCSAFRAGLPQTLKASDHVEGSVLHPDGHHVAILCRGRIFELALLEGPAVELRAPPKADGETPAFTRCLAWCYTMAGSVLILREAPPEDMDEAAMILELHPPNPYTPALEENCFWALEPLPSRDAPAPAEKAKGGIPDMWCLEPPRAVALPASLGTVWDMWPSPTDENVLAVTNERLELHLVTLEAVLGPAKRLAVKETRLVSRSNFGPEGISEVAWSWDGKWLAFASQSAVGMPAPRALWVFDTKADPATATAQQLTSGHFRDSSPAFDPAGQFLAFVSMRTLRPVDDEVTSSVGFGDRGCDRPFVLLLTEDAQSPLQRWPRAPAALEGGGADDEWDEEEEDEGDEGEQYGDERAPVHIEAAGADSRVLEVPVPPGRYSRIEVADTGLFYVRSSPESQTPIAAPGEDEEDDAAGTLFFFGFDRQRERAVTEGVMNFQLGMDGANLLLELEDGRLRAFSVEKAQEMSPEDDDEEGDDEEEDGGPGSSEERGYVSYDSRIVLEVRPQEEWRQMFFEVWRSVSTFLFDEALGGVDWLAIRSRYSALLGRLACRDDLTDVVNEMLGELGISHISLSDPDEMAPMGDSALGFLGADLSWDEEACGFRVAKLVTGDTWDVCSGGPLARARVAADALLLAVDRRRLHPRMPVDHLLGGRAGREVFLTFVHADDVAKARGLLRQQGASQSGAASPSAAAAATGNSTATKPKQKRKASTADAAGGKEKGTKKAKKSAKKTASLKDFLRTTRVRCGSFDEDRRARYRDWVEATLRFVHQVSGGRVGYVHVPDCEPTGFAEFTRYFQVECQREAMIIDLRGNGGGYISETLLDTLTRRPVGVQVPRQGRGQVSTFPMRCLRNARTTVLLSDARTCSDAECLLESFRDLGLGSAVGVRTWGGILSVGDCDVDLVDGSSLSIPSEHYLSLSSRDFTIENVGVRPDVEVDLPPNMKAGLDADTPRELLDPQLVRALREAERLLQEHGADMEDVLRRSRRFPLARQHLRWQLRVPRP